MKQLTGTAEGAVGALSGECLSLLAALEDYPSWYPEVVRSASVTERGSDGLPVRGQARLHVSHGPISRDFDLLLAITVAPDSVRLSRVPHGPPDGESFDVLWRVEERGSTHLKLELAAAVAIPRLVPVGGVGEAFAAGFMRAALARLGD